VSAWDSSARAWLGIAFASLCNKGISAANLDMAEELGGGRVTITYMRGPVAHTKHFVGRLTFQPSA
jgi:hypothetical protein